MADSEKDDYTWDSDLVSRLEKLSTGPLPELDIDLDDSVPMTPRKTIRQRIDKVSLMNVIVEKLSGELLNVHCQTLCRDSPHYHRRERLYSFPIQPSREQFNRSWLVQLGYY